MNVRETALPGVFLIEPDVFRDERGYFLETFRDERYEGSGLPARFVQDCVSVSRRGVLRGLHLQWPHAQGKLVYVIEGEIHDVAVDVRRDSAGFGLWAAQTLSGAEHAQLWIPPGFAHGFQVTSEKAIVSYKCTDKYDPECELTIRWDDPRLSIDWPVPDPVLSPKDAAAPALDEIDPERLPRLARGTG